MMFRPMQRVVRRVASSVPLRSMSTVEENTIRLVFVDREGNRAVLPGRIGKTLLETARLHKIDIEGPCNGGGGEMVIHHTPNWTQDVFGEGPTCYYCHVQIPSKFHHLLPPVTPQETIGMSTTWEEEFNMSSRLACQITLKREHDGMVVYVPDAPPSDII